MEVSASEIVESIIACLDVWCSYKGATYDAEVARRFLRISIAYVRQCDYVEYWTRVNVPMKRGGKPCKGYSVTIAYDEVNGATVTDTEYRASLRYYSGFRVVTREVGSTTIAHTVESGEVLLNINTVRMAKLLAKKHGT